MRTANVTTRQGSAAAMVPFYATREPVRANSGERRGEGTEQSYCFGSYRLVPRQRLLLKDGKPFQVGSKALDVLIVLAERQGDVVSKQELLARAWPGVTVDEGALRAQMTYLRKALGDGIGDACHIKTLAGRGYCLVATAVRSVEALSAAAERPPVPGQQLPPQLGRIFGRTGDIGKISALLQTKRFVTVVGAGAVGKTTTAIAVGHAMLAPFAGAVHFLDLDGITEPARLPGALASLLGLSVQAGDATQELLDHLRDRRMLLIFDGCEHLIEAVAVLIERIAHTTPQVSILATSREMLRTEGEHVYRLSGLECPREESGQSAEQVLEFAATNLFVSRVAASGCQFEITDANAPAVARICSKLDGLALAINVAAVRAQTFGLDEVANSLESRCWLLWRGQRTALARHQTIAATIDWSYGLLTEAEQAVLRRLSIFRDYFSLEAACGIARFGAPDHTDELLIIGKLVAKSLLAFESGNGVAGYRLLNSTRAYALEKLRRAGEFDTIAAKAREYEFQLKGQ